MVFYDKSNNDFSIQYNDVTISFLSIFTENLVFRLLKKNITFWKSREGKFKMIYTIWNFTALYFLIRKIKEKKFQNSFSHSIFSYYYYSNNMTYVHIFFLYRTRNISKKKIGKISNIKNILDQSKPNED